MKVRRITQGCCHITQGRIYEAKWDSGEGQYVIVKMDNGEWSSPHYFKGHFELVKEKETP